MKEEKSKTQELLDEVLSSGRLPDISNPDDVALAVVALRNYALDKMKPWYQEMDKAERYYRGDFGTEGMLLPGYRSRMCDNEIHTVVETLKPKVISGVAHTDILPVDDGDMDAVKGLGQRVKWAKRLSGESDMLTEIVHDQIVDGGCVLKCYEDVSFGRRSNRAVLRDPDAGSFDESMFIIDQKPMTLGEFEIEFGAKIKGLEAKWSELESEEHKPTGPVVGGGSGRLISFLPVDESSPVHRYIDTGYGSSGDKPSRVLVLECWFRDQTIDKTRDIEIDEVTGEEIEGESFDVLRYPCGRLTYVVVGTDDSGRLKDDSGDAQTLIDRENPFKKLYKGTSGGNDRHGKFPFAFIPCYPTDDLWSISTVTNLIPLQDGLNRAWRQLFDNMSTVVNPQKIISGLAGLKSGSVTGEPGIEITTDAAAGLDIDKVIKYTDIPPIIHHILPVISILKETMRQESGMLDVVRGERPVGGEWSGIAIAELKSSAMDRIMLKADRVSKGLKQVTEVLAYIAQEFDGDEMLRFPDESPYDEDQYVDYSPQESRDKAFRIVGTRRLSMQERAQSLAVGAELEAKGVPSEILFRDTEDPALYEYYRQKIDQMRQAKRDEALSLQREKMAGEMLKGALSGAGGGG